MQIEIDVAPCGFSFVFDFTNAVQNPIRLTMNAKPYLLGIDTSCDETSLAILNRETNQIQANLVSSQVKLHARFGGVVPELAAREHIENIAPLFEHMLNENKIHLSELQGVAVTQTPGLMGCLLVGTSFAKALAFRLGLPLYSVNHLYAHLFSPYVNTMPEFPFLGLVVSGGHTAFYKANNFHDIELLGQTVDDAAGEAFDKGAKLLGLGYPGGPIVDKYAKQGQADAFSFSIPKVKWDENLLSFSGLKTAMLKHVKTVCIDQGADMPSQLAQQTVFDLCASLQSGIVNALVNKLEHFLSQNPYKAFALSGGVAMNSSLRRAVQTLCEQRGLRCDLARPEFCTDNAAMVAYVASHQDNPVSVIDFSPRATVRVQAKALWHKSKQRKGSASA